MVLYMLKKRGLKWRHRKNMETYKKVAPTNARISVNSE